MWIEQLIVCNIHSERVGVLTLLSCASRTALDNIQIRFSSHCSEFIWQNASPHSGHTHEQMCLQCYSISCEICLLTHNFYSPKCHQIKWKVTIYLTSTQRSFILSSVSLLFFVCSFAFVCQPTLRLFHYLTSHNTPHSFHSYIFLSIFLWLFSPTLSLCPSHSLLIRRLYYGEKQSANGH